jgi:hypothetical protein
MLARICNPSVCCIKGTDYKSTPAVELLFPKDEFGKKSEARNRLLVDLLARTNFMEKAGTGINTKCN